MSKIPKYLWVILSILVVLVLALGVANVLISRKKNLSEREKISAGKNKISNLDAAKIGLDWLNKQRNADGIYRFYCKCLDSSCSKCENDTVTKRVWPFTVWARFKYYEKTKDPKDYAIFASDLKKVSNISEKIQFEFWKCKLMDDIRRSPVVLEEEKNLAANLCNSGREMTLIEQRTDINNRTNLELSQGINVDIQRILKNEKNWKTKFEKQDLVRDYTKAVAFSTDFFFAYKASHFKDIAMYKESIKNFYLAIEGYQFVDKNFYNNSILGISAVDFFVNTGGKNQQFLNLSRYLYDQIENIKYDEEPNSGNAIYFAMFADELFNATKDARFLDKRDSLIKEIVEKRFDYSDLDGFKNGAGCFNVGRNDGFCYTQENALTIGFLSGIK